MFQGPCAVVNIKSPERAHAGYKQQRLLPLQNTHLFIRRQKLDPVVWDSQVLFSKLICFLSNLH